MVEKVEGASPASAKRDYFAKVCLVGQNVRLEPLSNSHCDSLAEAGSDPAIWQFTATQHHEPGTMQSFIDSALAQYAERKAVPFAFVDIPSGKAVGSARLQYIEPAQRRLLIGGTWIGTAFQRSYINGEAKLLHLWYAFEVLGCRRVEFMTDAANAKSRAAFVKMGATEEGVFRKHMIYPDGRNRDSVYFSIIDDEWPTVRQTLEGRLGYKVSQSFYDVTD
ncbi:MAG: GNAT family N-acetyltransferase [Methylovirgula sp.]